MVDNLYKKAHILTKELCLKYDDVDYKTQFNLCLAYFCDESINKRVLEIMSEIKVSENEARLLEQVDFFFKNSFSYNLKLNFRIWKRQDKKRVYISSDEIKEKTYVDLNTKELHNKNLIKQF